MMLGEDLGLRLKDLDHIILKKSFTFSLTKLPVN